MKVSIDGRIFLEKKPTGVTHAGLLMLQKLIAYKKINWQIHTIGFKSPKLTSLPTSHIHHTIPNKLNNVLASLNLTTLDKMFGSFDVLWQPNPMFTPRITKPTIVTIHDLSLEIWPEFFDWHTRAWYNRYVKNFLKQFNSNVWLTAVSERTKQDIELFFPHWKGRVTHLAPVPPVIKHISTNESGLLKIGIKKPYIMVLSTIEPRKNMVSVYEAFSRLRTSHSNLRLVIVGDYKSSINITNNDDVIFTGYLNEADKNLLLSHAEVVIYPSYYEGFGYPPLEALAVGTPAIVSATGSLPETLKNGVLYVRPNNASSEIHHIISEIMNNKNWRQELVNSGQKQLQYLNDSYDITPMVNLIEKCASE